MQVFSSGIHCSKQVLTSGIDCSMQVLKCFVSYYLWDGGNLGQSYKLVWPRHAIRVTSAHRKCDSGHATGVTSVYNTCDLGIQDACLRAYDITHTTRCDLEQTTKCFPSSKQHVWPRINKTCNTSCDTGSIFCLKRVEKWLLMLKTIENNNKQKWSQNGIFWKNKAKVGSLPFTDTVCIPSFRYPKNLGKVMPRLLDVYWTWRIIMSWSTMSKAAEKQKRAGVEILLTARAKIIDCSFILWLCISHWNQTTYFIREQI